MEPLTSNKYITTPFWVILLTVVKHQVIIRKSKLTNNFEFILFLLFNSIINIYTQYFNHNVHNVLLKVST